jgi:hypothetical protein
MDFVEIPKNTETDQFKSIEIRFPVAQAYVEEFYEFERSADDTRLSGGVPITVRVARFDIFAEFRAPAPSQRRFFRCYAERHSKSKYGSIRAGNG